MALAARSRDHYFVRAAWGVVAAACLLLCSCGAIPGGVFSSPGPTAYPFPTGAPASRFPVRFVVHVPPATPSGGSVVLTVLDEVTGLSLNSHSYSMQSLGGSTWQVQLDLPRGGLVFYRYSLRTSSDTPEALANGGPLDYRVFDVEGPGQVEDQVSTWVGSPAPTASGVIRGMVRDATTGAAVPGEIVTAAGLRAYTDSGGSYALRGVPVGKHMLVAFSPDETYRPYEQEAIVASGEETPANLALAPAPRVSVAFHVFLPAGTPQEAPVRLIGNLQSLGNTFEPGPVGSMIPPERVPALTPLPDGSRVVVLSLPVGFTLKYKVTLGDGFWNAEHAANGQMVVRELEVPTSDLLVNVGVVSWGTDPQKGVTFNVEVPAGLPATEWVALQLSPFPGIWMDPLPMWPAGPQRWTYQLLSPMGWPENIAYRYCRNSDCGVADEAAAPGVNPKGRQLSPTPLPQTLQDTVTSWVGWSTPALAQQGGRPSIAARPGFRTGVVFSPGNWPPPYEPTLVDLVALHPQVLLLCPIWSLGAVSPLPEITFSPHLGSSARQDLLNQMAMARAAGVQVGLAPAVEPASGTLGAWWGAASKGLDWWNAWFSAYREFLVSNADTAQLAGAQEFIVARSEILPALPGIPGAPADADTRWRVLIRDLRAHFSGRIGIELVLANHLQTVPTFLDEVDDVYIQVRAPLATSDNASVSDMTTAAGSLLDNNLSALRAAGKPLLVEAAIASAVGGASGCPQDSTGHCLDLEALRPGSSLAIASPLNLNLQSRAIQSLLAAAASRDWISGFLAWDYYPQVGLQDASASVHGKPAESVLAAYFEALK